MVLVLVVEDESLIQMEIESSLQEGGFSTDTAGNGEDAISRLEAGAGIRAIVTDINLGGSVTGWDVARRGRELTPNLPVVYVTSASAAEWTSQGVPNSVLIAKPFVGAQIITALSQLLNTISAEAVAAAARAS